MADGNKPVHQHRSGALSASIFAREHNGETFYSVQTQRAFTRDDGKTWEYSSSFNRDDLPMVAALVTEAWRTIMKLENQARERK
jgi:hypothetical protein